MLKYNQLPIGEDKITEKIRNFVNNEGLQKSLLTVWCWRRGGIEAEKLSNRTKIVGSIHFPKRHVAMMPKPC